MNSKEESMTRFGSLIFCATLGSGLLACGSSGTSSSKDPLDLVPLDNALSGWTVDQAHNKPQGARAMTATTAQEAVDLIDGAAAPFYKAPYTPKEFLWQNYLNATLPAAPPNPNNPVGASVVLYILQMPSADQASGLYTALLTESEYAGHDWQPTSPPVGTESRIEDTVVSWWVNFHQDVFYVEVFLSPSYGPPPDFTPGNADLKNEAIRFAQAIASKI
jgi:hypothetical protein